MSALRQAARPVLRVPDPRRYAGTYDYTHPERNDAAHAINFPNAEVSMATNEIRQPIPLVMPDIVSAVIALLDAQLVLAKALDYASAIGILPNEHEFVEVRHAVLLWATAHGFQRTNVTGDEMRAIRIHDGARHLVSLHVPDECDFDPKKPAPAPRLIVDQDAMWSPASQTEMP